MVSAPNALERLQRRLRRRPAVDPGRCTVLVDGVPVYALTGQSVAATLVQAGIWRFHRHPISGEPRGPYCGMGVCFECELNIDGLTRRACLVEVQASMAVTTMEEPGDSA